MGRSRSVPLAAALASPGLAGLVDRARYLRQIDAAVRAALPDSLSAHAQVANLHEDGLLVMVTDSAAWATRLRYQRQKILQTLRRDYSIPSPELEVKVYPAAFD
jgi:hypothetical protein